MAKAHVPTSAQLAKLATLQSATATTAATLASAQTSLASAQQAYINAKNTEKDYERYIWGGRQANIVDGGSQDNV